MFQMTNLLYLSNETESDGKKEPVVLDMVASPW